MYQSAQKNRRQADMTAKPERYPQGGFKKKPCRKCGTIFQPLAPSHLYCTQECADWGVQSAYLLKKYGIDLDQYHAMREAQGSLCAICRKPGFKMGDSQQLLLVVDHCHDTGKVRGLLCHNCNRALGLLQDDTAALSRAIGYLEGATTIPEGSTAKRPEARSPVVRPRRKTGEDIVCPAQECAAGEEPGSEVASTAEQ